MSTRLLNATRPAKSYLEKLAQSDSKTAELLLERTLNLKEYYNSPEDRPYPAMLGMRIHTYVRHRIIYQSDDYRILRFEPVAQYV